MAAEEPPAPAPAAAEEADPAPPPAAVIDPCDPKRLMFDSIDLLAYEIITNPSKRAERKGQLEVGLISFACLSVPYQFICTAGVLGGKSSLPRNEPKRAEGSRAYISNAVMRLLAFHI